MSNLFLICFLPDIAFPCPSIVITAKLKKHSARLLFILFKKTRLYNKGGVETPPN